jgi:Transposase DDE domain
MRSIKQVEGALHEVFGKISKRAAAASGVIRRKRKFDAVNLAKTFVLGFLQKPNATDEELAQVAAQVGAVVTPQAIDQRHTPQLVEFLQGLFRQAVQCVVASKSTLSPILERFTNVTLMDSTLVALPDEYQQEYPGCGGSVGTKKAALKLQVEFDLRSGALRHLEVQKGRQADGSTSGQQTRRGKGSLRIADLGYFNTYVFAAMQAAGEYFLSRLQYNVGVMSPDGEKLELLAWLRQQTGSFVDAPLLLNHRDPLACRLLAWRLPPEQAARQRARIRHTLQRRESREPTAKRLAWCDWRILVTNVPAEKLSVGEAAVLYGARWQIELLFKRWKSDGLIAQLQGATAVRQLVRVWARLIGALIQHWLIVTVAWGDPSKSLAKLGQAVRSFAGRMLVALHHTSDLRQVLNDFAQILRKTCRRNKRKNPGTFELLNNTALLKFGLT